ncbi:MAG: beta-galactosidase [Opitutaceae bacterium]|nr:beta-galactosidase [Opitutaceae bacterium]
MNLTVTTPLPSPAVTFKTGTIRAPDGSTLALDSRSLLLNGRRWTPVMGEFHYARYPAAKWRGELAKMKAGGIDIVATYVFWIHHEETEGAWNWSGDRNLHDFITAAADAGLKVIVRCGPWCHGEVRNGGLPDWIVARPGARTDDPAYLASTQKLYAQIAAQVAGLLWKDGGPVIGIQLENEYGGPAEHLLTLKRLTVELGLDVPLYTRTGWPELQTPMPFGEIIPLYGVYAEGFWDRELTSMPGNYWAGFHFSTLRTDANIANEALGRREVRDEPDIAHYPYLTCEIGGGMMSSYHRRILVDPRDIEAVTLVKLGSGSNSPGYYMYHGGTNPDGELTPLMESQDSAFTNWNDLPHKNYDFQAPLGAAGQIRPHYYLLRRLHRFLHAFGEQLAGMDTFLPDQRPAGKDDVATLRWSVRSDGQRGFVFFNHHERGRDLPAKSDVQFAVTLADGSVLTFPDAPVSLPSGNRFIWPFNLELGHGVTLTWATAQPVTLHDQGSERTVWFAATPGIGTQFCFATEVDSPAGPTRLLTLVPGEHRITASRRDSTQTLRFIVLTEKESLRLFDPAPPVAMAPLPVAFDLLRAAGPLRKIPPAATPYGVASAPTDADFANAAVWKINLPADYQPASGQLLRLRYTGDVARIYLGDKLIMDDFYNGLPLELDLSRYAEELKTRELTVAILPLQKDAPIFFSDPAALPDFKGQTAVAELHTAEIAGP